MLILWWQANVVVKRQRAHLTEYGLHSIYSDPGLTDAKTPGAEDMSRWLAPEIVNPTSGSLVKKITKQGDVFAFGMVAFEIFSGQVPFSGSKAEDAVLKINKGKRPDIQTLGLTSGRKKLIQSCWDRNPKKRPTMEHVVKQLREPEGEAEPKAFCGIFWS